MTEKEAIELLRYMSAFNSTNGRRAEAIELAIKALEKQIGRKTKRIYIMGESCKIGVCLVCENAIAGDSLYCKYCGQKLDWSEEQ